MNSVTLALPDDLAQWVRVRAAENGRNESEWIAERLERMRRYEDEYDVAMNRFRAGAGTAKARVGRRSQADAG